MEFVDYEVSFGGTVVFLASSSFVFFSRAPNSGVLYLVASFVAVSYRELEALITFNKSPFIVRRKNGTNHKIIQTVYSTELSSHEDRLRAFATIKIDIIC